MDFLLVDDHPMIHETLSAVVRSLVPQARIHSENDLAGALSRGRELHELQLVLLDLGLPGCSGIDALLRLRKALPGVRIVIISASDDAQSVRGALDAGAVGYVPKTSPPRVLAEALRLVLGGGIYVPPEGAAPRKTATLADLGLTARQADVLKLLAKGLANGEIARRLEISENTVKQHAHAAYRLLGVSSRTEALVLLARLGVRDS
ncbi:MAG TPA: response regulator transcription factor [Burkholderiales bacterium]|nr:response regulator transcription factor [Burkholderiales bacterium]